jgi:hypothetical protein
MSPEKGLLGQVLRDGRIANDAANVAMDGLPVCGQLLRGIGMEMFHVRRRGCDMDSVAIRS